MLKNKKLQLVQDLEEKFNNCKSAVFADYRGISVKEVDGLRRELQKNGIDFKVVKNTLARIALDRCHIEGADQLLVGPTGIAFGYDDPVLPAKVISNYANSSQFLKIKGAIFEKRVIDMDQVKVLARLPGREELLARTVSTLNMPLVRLVNALTSPMRSLVYALKAIEGRKYGLSS